MLFPDHLHLLISTVYLAMALCYISFQCLTSGFMQLASGFMQLAATGCRRNILYCHCLFGGKCYLCIRMGITILKIIIWGDVSSDMHSEVTFLAPLTCHPKLNFLSICLTITTQIENFEYSYPLNVLVLIIIYLLYFYGDSSD